MTINQDISGEKKKKRDLNQKVLFAWYTGIKNARLYSPNHPSYLLTAQRLVSSLKDVFQHTLELSIQHIDGLFRIEEDLFIEESLTMYELLRILEEAKISRVLFLPGINDEETHRFLNYLFNLKKASGPTQSFATDHLRVFLETENDSQSNPRERTYQRIKDVQSMVADWGPRAESMFSKLLDEQTLSLSDLSNPLDQLIDALHLHPSLFAMALVTQDMGPLHIAHAVRTMIVSIYLGQQLNYDLPTLKLLALSALCHDIGRQFLPAEFGTGTPLQPADMEFVRLHARDGASFLAGIHGLPSVLVRVALEHHMGWDGQGYPTLPAGFKPHILAQIVGLADFVSWQTLSEHHYHKPVPIYKLMRALIRRSGSQFQPVLVKLALPFFGLFPPGTVLKLGSHEQAIALEPNNRHAWRPAIVTGANDRTYRWLSETSDPPDSFGVSIDRIIGSDPQIEKYFQLIPNLFQNQM